ncbi:MAG: hypothetical protein M3295_07330 [Chloroflexota bacterium]|nr:hypothetical protein [Chloroflexota bacterium]
MGEVFAGTVDGIDAYIALVSDGTRLIGYVSDGNALSTWFSGTVHGDSIALVSRSDDPLGEGTVSGDASGEILIGGERHPFNAPAVSDTAGLYRAVATNGDESVAEAGWIVLENGSQRGAVNIETKRGTDATVRPARAIDPADPREVALAGFGAVPIERVTTVPADWIP